MQDFVLARRLTLALGALRQATPRIVAWCED